MESDAHAIVKDYYGSKLKTTADLQTNACCTSVREAMKLLSPEVENTYYGCGLVVPEVLAGLRVLDLGCGTGRDCFVLAKLVGENGRVVGVDMTDEQLAIANKNVEFHMKAFGYSNANVEFKKGYIERLHELGLSDSSFDVIVSNCVINLCPDKKAVFDQAFRLLKPGGELYFSDVYSDRRVPAALTKDPVLWGECLSGALYWNDFLHLARSSGFLDPRLVQSKPITIGNPKISALLGPVRFYSAEYRLFKIAALEPDCEDYGQAVIYKGTIAPSPHEFRLDGHHSIPKGKVFPVCGNTYHMLKHTRFAPHFEFLGDGATHYGIFAGCGKQIPFSDSSPSSPASSCSSSCC